MRLNNFLFDPRSA